MENMTHEELIQLKDDWYLEAFENGNLEKINAIARLLGRTEFTSMGKRQYFQKDGYLLYYDHHAGYCTLKKGMVLVFSTHPTQRLYVKGVCDLFIARYYPDVEKDSLDQTPEYAEAMRSELENTLFMGQKKLRARM